MQKNRSVSRRRGDTEGREEGGGLQIAKQQSQEKLGYDISRGRTVSLVRYKWVLRDTWPTSVVLFPVETVANDELSRKWLQQHNPPSLVQLCRGARPVLGGGGWLRIRSRNSHRTGRRRNSRHSRGRRRSLPDSHHTRSSRSHNLTEKDWVGVLLGWLLIKIMWLDIAYRNKRLIALKAWNREQIYRESLG